MLYKKVEIAHRLLESINAAHLAFGKIPVERWNKKSAPGKWSKKEILGHLIDSAANNHQRFVRAQFVQDEFTGPGYEQDLFVTLQAYNSEDIQNLILLWMTYNTHLAHVIKNADETKMETICRIGNYEPQTLGFVMHDYVDHLNHHLEEIFKDE